MKALLIAAMLALPVPAHAGMGDTGAELMELCDLRGPDISTAEEAAVDLAWCTAYIRGFAQGVILAKEMSPTMPICFPATWTANSVMAGARLTLRQYPKVGGQPVDYFLYLTLFNLYRCK